MTAKKKPAAKKKATKPKPLSKQEKEEIKAKPNFPLPDVATDSATQAAKEASDLDPTGTLNEAEAHAAHVQGNANDTSTADRRKDEMEQADAAAAPLKKAKSNNISKSNLPDYGFKQTKDGIDADTTWSAFAVDGDRDDVVHARRIDAKFKVGKNEVDDGYLVVDSKGAPKAVEKADFEDGTYTAA